MSSSSVNFNSLAMIASLQSKHMKVIRPLTMLNVVGFCFWQKVQGCLMTFIILVEGNTIEYVSIKQKVIAVGLRHINEYAIIALFEHCLEEFFKVFFR